MNEDRWYDKGQYDEEPEHLGDCGCGEEIYEGYPHISIDEEVFCDITCVMDFFVKQNYDIKENETDYEETKLLGECKCENLINSEHEFYLIDGEYYCDSCCVFDYLIKENHDVEE